MASRNNWISIMNGHIINKDHVCEIEYLVSDLENEEGKSMFIITMIGGKKHEIYESNKNHNYSGILAYWNAMRGYDNDDDDNDDTDTDEKANNANSSEYVCYDSD